MFCIKQSGLLLLALSLSSVLFFDTASALFCRDLFSSPQGLESLREMGTLSASDLSVHPEEVQEHGLLLFQSGDASVLGSIHDLISTRDGTYPVLIDSSGALALDHRLPDPSVTASQPFLGTHRGLFRKLESALQREPQVVFAGELRVIGGRVFSLSDQSGTFAIRLAAGATASERQELIESNQRRLQTAELWMQELGIIGPNIELVNFLKSPARSQERGLTAGVHVRAREAALFELECRDFPKCWQAFLQLDRQLRWLVSQGGQEFLQEKAFSATPQLMELAFEHFQFWVLILNEGALDHLAQGERFVPGSEQFEAFEKFMENSNRFFQEVLGQAEATSHL